MRSRHATGMLLSALLVFGAPLAAAGDDVRVVLDRHTGTTQRLSAAAWTFALDQPHLAAHTRDYIALHAVEISNAGARRHFLAAFFWSTVPGRNRFAGDGPSLRLVVDDRELLLDAPLTDLRSAGVGQWPLRPPGRDALAVLYAVDPQLLRQLARAAIVRIRPESDASLPAGVWFEPWRSGQDSFRQFARSVLDDR